MTGAMYYFKKILFNTIFIIMISSLSLAQTNMVRYNLSVKQSNYEKVKQAVESVNGKVNFTFKFVNAMTITIPADKVQTVLSKPEIQNSQKDARIFLPDPQKLSKFDHLSFIDEPVLNAAFSKTMKADEIVQAYKAMPENYDPFTNNLTKANQFIKETGFTGKGVIVAVMDAGISSAATAVADRIIGGENFTDDGISATSPLNGYHGTAVACCIGANAIFGFNDPAIQNAVKKYAPNSVIENYFGNGIDGIPMIGQAPGASFYALKVFRYNENGTETSIMVAALERAIELKEMYNKGISGGINIRVLNISIGGFTNYAGNDPIFGPLINRALEAGIMIIKSAGNSGPSGMTITWPGDGRNLLTVGAANDATHQRIYSDLVYGPGYGYLFRPVDNNLLTYFSSRGPNADGRPDPDISAPGAYRYMQMANGNITWASGTSFAAPTVAGAAALLISSRPGATPYEIRGALLNGADKSLMAENAGVQDQGFGYLNVYNAYKKLTAGVFNPPDIGVSSNNVAWNINIQDNIKTITSTSFSASTGWLHPGQRSEFYYVVPKAANTITITLSNVTPQLPIDKQNVLFGDDVMFSIQKALTSYEDYFQGTPVLTKSPTTFVMKGQDLYPGIIRVSVLGDWKNAGNIMASISISSNLSDPSYPSFTGSITQNQTSDYKFDIPAGSKSFDLRLYWKNGWGNYPTNDLDILLWDPNGKMIIQDLNNDFWIDGQSFTMPEYISVSNPIGGLWKVGIQGTAIFTGEENFQLEKLLNGKPFGKSSPDNLTTVEKQIPKEFSLQQNMPNPFNPTTLIKFDLPVDTYISLKIYNSLGQLVRTLAEEQKSAGYHSVVFDGRDDSGNNLSSGMYIYQLSSEKFVRSAKMLLIK